MSNRKLRAGTLAARPLITSASSTPEPRRSTRLQSSVKNYENQSAPARKKRKTTVVLYSCSSCREELPARTFPSRNPTSDCEHLINTCKSCLKGWIEAQMDGNLVSTGGSVKSLNARCPECPKLMKNTDIQAAVSPKIYERYNELDRHHTAEHTAGWRWCLSPSCDAGQVYDPSVEAKPVGVRTRRTSAKAKQQSTIMRCNKCNFETCVTCDRPWHEGETCGEYQFRTKDRVDEEDKALETISKITSKCPTCQAKIEKNGGCPHMICTQCNKPFCWNCMGIFKKNGRCSCQPTHPPALAPPPQHPLFAALQELGRRNE